MLRPGSAVRVRRPWLVLGLGALALLACALPGALFLAQNGLPSLPPLPASVRHMIAGRSGGGAAVFPDALAEPTRGEPVLLPSTGDFYARVGGKDAWLLLFHSRDSASHAYADGWRTVVRNRPLSLSAAITTRSVAERSSWLSVAACGGAGGAGGSGGALPCLRLRPPDRQGRRRRLRQQAGPRALRSRERRAAAVGPAVRGRREGYAGWSRGPRPRRRVRSNHPQPF